MLPPYLANIFAKKYRESKTYSIIYIG